jgi:putative transposase
MARRARAVLAGLPYHITHRGNNGANTFLEAEDRETYLRWVIEYSARYQMEVWAYCLMENHVHFLAVNRLITSLSFTFRALEGRYAQWINRKYERKGHLWEGRFYSAPLDETHLWTAVRYVELNPVRAGLVERAEDYPWSSARAHCNGRANALLADSSPFPGPIDDWSRWLEQGITAAEAETIRDKTLKGHPFGSDAFVRRLEETLGRSLRPGKNGRPKTRR